MPDNVNLASLTGNAVTREFTHAGDTAQLQGVFLMGTTGSEGSYAAQDLARAEDSAHTSGDLGIPVLGVRQDADTSPVGSDGDYHSLLLDQVGRLKVSTQPASTAATTGTITASAQTISMDVTRQSNVAIYYTGTFAGINLTFEASVDGGTNWFAVAAVRTNSATVELTTGVLSAAPAYAHEVSVNAYTNFRVRSTAWTSGTMTVTMDPGSFATEPSPVVQIAAAQTLGTVTTVSTVTNVATIGTSVTPGTAAANLGKAEDAVHATGDVGVMALAVRQDTRATLASATGDYVPLTSDATGGLYVNAQGPVAHDAAIAGNPVRIAGRALTADYTAVAAGDTADIITTLTGKVVNYPFANPNQSWNYAAASGGLVNTTGVTARAAAGAGIRNYITCIDVVNSHPTVGTEILIRDGAAGTVLHRGFAAAAGGGYTRAFNTPLRGTANTLVEIAEVTTTATTGVYVNLSGFSAAE
jgi:hypothetical protein